MSEITFKADKKHRDKYFSANSFAHPAKMMLPLQRWLIERYTKPGDVILDPMAGCGTLLIACTMGRNVILVELEAKFVQMQKDNWAKIQTLGAEMGYEMGTATILQGDARNLPDVLADAIISSPPYSEVKQDDTHKPEGYWDKVGGIGHKENMTPDDTTNIGNLPYGKLADVVISSPPYNAEPTVSAKYLKIRSETGRDINQPSCKYAKYSADVIMTSPPYALTIQKGHEGVQAWKVIEGLKGASNETLKAKSKELLRQGKILNEYGDSPDNLGNLPYGSIDAVITSPPYEGIEIMPGGQVVRKERIGTEHEYRADAYNKENSSNIGNLKGQSYLSAMKIVYENCFRVLKPQGLMCLVTKNFIRNKTEIRLDLDTIKLCEQAGFELIERHYRKLTSQSFWRTIYAAKYPDAPVLDTEDILVFKK